MKNKIISIILSVTMVLSLVVSNSAFVLAAEKVGFHTEIEKTSVKNDGTDTFTVDVYLDHAVKSAGIELHLAFDPKKLTMNSATKVCSQGFMATEPAEANDGGTSAGVIKMLFEDANMKGMDFAAGKLYSISFTVKAGAATGDIMPVLTVEALNDAEASPIANEVTKSDSIEVYSLINTAQAISITAPVKGATPQAAINVDASAGYTAAIAWEGNPTKFAAGTAYAAAVTLTAKSGYQFGNSAAVTVAGGNVSGKSISADGKTLSCRVAFPATAARVLSSITITAPPTKTSYVEGQNFDKSGMVVKAAYDDGSENANFTAYTVEDGTNLAPGKTSVTIKAGNQTATQAITVAQKEITSIAITKQPAKLTFVIGDKAPTSWQGLEVTATYNDDTKRVLAASDYTVTGFNSSAYAETQQLTVTARGKTATFTVKIDKKTLTAEDFDVAGLTTTYDGTAKQVSVTPKTGVAAGAVTIKYDGNATRPTDAGTYAVTFDVAESASCKAAAGLKAGNLVIAKKAISISGVTIAKRAYNKTDLVEVTAVSFDGATLVKGTDYTVKGVLKDINAGKAKDVTVTVTLKNANYSLATYVYTGQVDIDKVAAPVVADTAVTATAQVAKEHLVKIAGVPADAGDTTYTVGTPTGTSSILAEAVTADKNGVLTVKLNNTGVKGNTVTIPVTIATANYANITTNVVVTLTDKVVPNVTAKDITVTYTGKAVDVNKAEGKATAAVTEGEETKVVEIAGTWSFDGTAPVNAADSGTKTIVFTPTGEDADTYAVATATISVIIEKATTTANAKFTEITEAGKTLADAALKVTSPSGEGTFAWDDIETTVVEKGRAYGWTFTPNDSNYNAVKGSVTPWKAAAPSFGGPVTEPKATVTVNGEGGKAELAEDGTVLTITPEEGYEITSVVLNGKDMGAVTELKDLKATDTIVVTFAKKEEQSKEELIAQIKGTKLTAVSKVVKINGKNAVRITWKAEDNSKVDFDGYEVFRSTKRYSGFGKKPIFNTKNSKYFNTAVKKGTKYYYKIRAYKIIDGEKVYTGWSTKAWRTVK